MVAVAIIVGALVAIYAVHTANDWLFGKAGERLGTWNAERDRRRRQSH